MAPKTAIKISRNLLRSAAGPAGKTKDSWRRVAARSHQLRRLSPERLWRTPSPSMQSRRIVYPYRFRQTTDDCGCWVSVVKAVAHLHEDFPRVQEVRSPKRKTVVQQDPPVGHVDPLDVHGEPFAETLPSRKVKRRVRLQVLAGIGRRRAAVGKARGVGHVGRSVGPPRQVVLRADVQGIPLVMIEQPESIPKAEIRKAPVDVPEPERQLIRVGQINLATVLDARRTQRQFPS